MSVDVTAERLIRRPIDEVARYAFDPANDPVWIGGIREAEMLTEPPVREGTRVRRIASFLGRRIEYVLEVAELAPDRTMVMRSVKSPFPMTVTYGFEDAGTGTLARIRVEGEPGGFYRMVPGVGGAVRRSISRDLERLKRELESGATSS